MANAPWRPLTDDCPDMCPYWPGCGHTAAWFEPPVPHKHVFTADLNHPFVIGLDGFPVSMHGDLRCICGALPPIERMIVNIHKQLVIDAIDHIEALNELLVAYRVGGRTPEKALRTLGRTRVTPGQLQAALDADPRGAKGSPPATVNLRITMAGRGQPESVIREAEIDMSQVQAIGRILDDRCPIRSSITDQPCLLPAGHDADSPTRFHRFAVNPTRDMYSRLAAQYRETPAVPDHGGGSPGDLYDKPEAPK